MMGKIEVFTNIGMKTFDTDDYVYGMCHCMVGYILHKKDKDKRTECSDCSGKQTHYVQNVCMFCTNMVSPETHHDEPDWCKFHEMPIEDVFKQTRYEIVDEDEPSLLDRLLRRKGKVYRKDVTRDIPRNGCVGLETNLRHQLTE